MYEAMDGHDKVASLNPIEKTRQTTNILKKTNPKKECA